MSVRSPSTSRSIAIAHPYPLVAQALATIATNAGCALVKACGDRMRTALVTADFAIVAVQLDGIAVLRTRRAAGIPTVVIVDDPNVETLLAIVGLAAEGLVLMTSPAAAITDCLTAVASGKQWLDSEATRLIIDRVAHPAPPTLTRRERDVANLVAAGQRNRTIAERLSITEGTVKMHLHNVYGKLGIESRTQLAMELRVCGV